MIIFKEPTRIIGIILLCFALISAAGTVKSDLEIIGLTPEKCTMETEGRVIDSAYGTKLQHGSNRRYSYSVYYDVIEYEVDNHKYQITSRHASKNNSIIGATVTVYYNPNDPSKAYDNSAPYVDGSDYFYPFMMGIIGLVLTLGLGEKIKKQR
ncbi:MAG: DUF3592 domain-containing protein [Eubacteriales bacterium]|nr:DUF3592 domain-containing protein [Eubacteriales bacterium]